MNTMLIIAVFLALVDAVVTSGRLRMNPSLELNPLVKWITSRIGSTWASVLGVFLIQSVIATILAMFTSTGLALFVGASLYRTYTQALSLRYF